MKLYSILDAKAETWLPPFLAMNHEMAKRDVYAALRGNADIPIAQYPTDFALVCLGEWSAGTPNPITLANMPENLGTVWQIQHEFSARLRVAKASSESEGE